MRFLKFLRSMKLAVFLLGFLALVSLPSTLITQGEPPGFYSGTLGPGISGIVLFFGLDNVFSSPLFYTSAVLFFINLSYCTLWRLIRELKRKGRGRHGPDILHVGLIIFLAGAVISAVFGKETPILWMEPGDYLTLPRGGRFTLTAFESEYYEDGRPESWMSAGIHSDAEGDDTTLSISVNSPVRLEGVKIYQSSYRLKPVLLLDSSVPVSLEPGDLYAGLLFHSLQNDGKGSWLALFADNNGSPVTFREGEMIGDVIVRGFETREVTGLRMTRDPGVKLVFISFALIAAGLALILFEKRKNL